MHLVGPAIAREARADAATVADDQLVHSGVALDAHPRLFGDPLPQRATDLATRRVGRMQHPAPAVRALASEREAAVSIALESRAPGDQSLDVAHAVGDQDIHGRVHAQAVTGRNGVGGMLRRGITVTDGRGDPALRVARVAFCGIGLGENQHITGQRQIGGGAKAGDAAANDQ